MRKKTVLFDFDGTIADSIPSILEVLNAYAPRYGFEPLKDNEFEPLREHNLQELIKKFNVPFYRMPFLVAGVRREVARRIDGMGLCKDIDKTLETLKNEGVRMGIVSSSPRVNIELFLRNHRIDSFEFIHSQLNLFGKAAALAEVMKRYGLTRNETLYVGDEMRDVEACREAGLEMIGVTWGLNSEKGLKKQGAIHIARTPGDILTLLEKM